MTERTQDRERRRRGKKRIVVTVLAWVIAGAAALALAAVILAGAFALSGRNRLLKGAESEAPNLASAVSADGTEEETEREAEQEKSVWQEDWIKYNGKIYTYKKDIMTFLIMGIDKNTEAVYVA